MSLRSKSRASCRHRETGQAWRFRVLHAEGGSYNEEKHRGHANAHDIGIIKFSNGPLQEYEPIPVLEDESVLDSQTRVVVAGFGYDSNDISVAKLGVLKYAKAQIRVTDSANSEFKLDVLSSSKVCVGDSGGVALAQINGVWKLFGIISRIEFLDGDPYGQCSRHVVVTSVLRHSSWISSAQKRLGSNASEKR